MRIQTPFEEKLNTLTHIFGALLGVVGLILMLIHNSNKTPYSLFSIWVYGCSIIVLFTASAVYHATKSKKKKHYFRILDHISIYLLIAGTYTPITLIALLHSKGWSLFGLEWGIATFGIILKLFFTGKFNVFSTLLYLVMGWVIVIDYVELKHVMDPNGVNLLFAGGVAYTFGVVFYAVEKMLYNHVIWHLFVLAGAIFHFFMIYFYVI
ncbi:MAG: PAQR family membrane homeostasis protein TrhA [Aestuariibaculum sp.]